MLESKLSLCISYPNRNSPDQNLFFRIADFDENEGSFTTASNEPRIIGAKPRDVAANMAVIRKWEMLEDGWRTESSSYQGIVYEVVFPKELSGISIQDTKKIREVLTSGFVLDEYSCDELLMVIGSQQTELTTLYCPKRNMEHNGSTYKVSGNNLADMLHSLHFLEEYVINKSDIINSENVVINLLDGTRAPTRFFYRFINLPPKTCNYNLFDIKNYIPNYISKYLKRKREILQFSEKDIRKFVAFAEEILSDYDKVKDYYAITGHNYNDILTVLPQYANDICKALLNETNSDQIISKCVLGANDLKQKLVELARVQWLAEKNEEKDAVNIEIEIGNHRLNEIIETIAKEEKRREQMVADIELLQANLREAQGKLTKVNVEIENELTKFSDNIVHNITLGSVFKVLGGGNLRDKASIYTYISNQSLIEDSNIEITEKDDLEEALTENLSSSGFKASAYEIAQLIIHCVQNSIPLIVSGNGLGIANSVAALIDSKGASVVNIPVGYNDLADITESIMSSPGSIVYLTGVFDGFSENIFHAIKDSCKIKTLIMSADGVDISLFSSSIWTCAFFLDGDIFFDFHTNKSLKSYITKEIKRFYSYTYEANAIAEKKRLLKPLLEAGIINNTAAVHYSKLMVDIDSDVKSDWTLLLQIYIYAKSLHKSDNLSELLPFLDINERCKTMLSKYI